MTDRKIFKLDIPEDISPERILINRAKSLVDQILADNKYVTAMREDYKSDPTRLCYTHIDIESGIRFNIAIDPASADVFGKEFYNPGPHDDFVESLRTYCKVILASEIYGDMWPEALALRNELEPLW